ncbi:MAG TPA: hypothetical protein VIF12_06755 [Micavibrio sp.]|jgi:hypothetical protein
MHEMNDPVRVFWAWAEGNGFEAAADEILQAAVIAGAYAGVNVALLGFPCYFKTGFQEAAHQTLPPAIGVDKDAGNAGLSGFLIERTGDARHGRGDIGAKDGLGDQIVRVIDDPQDSTAVVEQIFQPSMVAHDDLAVARNRLKRQNAANEGSVQQADSKV